MQAIEAKIAGLDHAENEHRDALLAQQEQDRLEQRSRDAIAIQATLQRREEAAARVDELLPLLADAVSTLTVTLNEVRELYKPHTAHLNDIRRGDAMNMFHVLPGSTVLTNRIGYRLTLAAGTADTRRHGGANEGTITASAAAGNARLLAAMVQHIPELAQVEETESV
ncbi:MULTISPECIES: hypothetical protein [Sphingomonas]|uniref:Uncharacterized protein n=1 Tax=Sphingomonas molluscorum TaxID=418184 RepID=A0ABU8Q799_9SPHN|nr:hypothetical protein [Sphingomonas sp. JUb134]MBM7406922.1 hypothetical protein [Sphingomonas sp. JUb134]